MAKDRSLVDDLEAMVEADNALAAARERTAEGETVELTDSEQDAVDAALDFFEVAVETGDQTGDIDMDTPDGDELVEGLYALRSLADGNGDTEDASVALREIASFGKAMQKTLMEAITGGLPGGV